jgi:hypothetical protein
MFSPQEITQFLFLKQQATTMLLSPLDVLKKGFVACNGLPDFNGKLNENL